MARWGRRRRSATGWARNPLAAPLRVCATCDALGESTRVTVPAISAVSDQLGLFVCQTDYGGRKCGSTTELGSRPDTCPLMCTCEVQEDGEIRRCNGSRDFDASSPTQFGSLPGGLQSRETPTGWARKSRLALFDARATPNEFGRTSRVADSQISRLSARPDLIPYWTGRRRKKCRPAVGRARNPVLGLPPVCTRCGRPGKSIRVTDPEISAL